MVYLTTDQKRSGKSEHLNQQRWNRDWKENIRLPRRFNAKNNGSERNSALLGELDNCRPYYVEHIRI